jgi:hypothetical protein
MSGKRILGMLAVAFGLLIVAFGVFALLNAIRFTIAQPLVLAVGLALVALGVVALKSAPDSHQRSVPATGSSAASASRTSAVGWKTVVVALMAVPVMIYTFMRMYAPPSPAKAEANRIAHAQVEAAITAALKAERLFAPTSIEIEGARLVADYQIGELHRPMIVNAGLTSFEDFAKKVIVVIVKTTRPFNIDDNMIYRVNVNEPGDELRPDSIKRIGSATFHERGGDVEWQAGPSKLPF